MYKLMSSSAIQCRQQMEEGSAVSRKAVPSQMRSSPLLWMIWMLSASGALVLSNDNNISPSSWVVSMCSNFASHWNWWPSCLEDSYIYRAHFIVCASVCLFVYLTKTCPFVYGAEYTTHCINYIIYIVIGEWGYGAYWLVSLT